MAEAYRRPCTELRCRPERERFRYSEGIARHCPPNSLATENDRCTKDTAAEALSSEVEILPAREPSCSDNEDSENSHVAVNRRPSKAHGNAGK